MIRKMMVGYGGMLAILAFMMIYGLLNQTPELSGNNLQRDDAGGSAFGWPSMACIIIFIGGIQLFCMGILGSYLAKTYLEVKGRPIYICKETNIEKEEK